MQTSALAVVQKPRLPVRVTVGLCLSGVSLFLLVFPGEMVVPAMALSPVLALPSSCLTFLAAPMAFAIFGLALLMSVVLIGVGVTGIVLSAIQARGGLTTAVVVNAVIATSFLMIPLSFRPGELSAPTTISTGVFYAVCALPSLAAAVLMLAPSLYRSPHAFKATVIVAGLLLLPGAAGLTALSLQVAGRSVYSAPAQSTSQAGRC